MTPPPQERVLIATNPLNHDGGVVNYYRVFLRRFESEELELVHHTFGSRMEHYYSPLKKRLLYPFCYVWDYLRFLWRLLTDRRTRIVQVSPSLIPVPLVRDGLVLLGARLFRRRTIVFYRGWKPNVVDELRKHRYLRWLFGLVYGRCDCSIVLAERFKGELDELCAPHHDIEVTTTMTEKEAFLPPANRTGEKPRFLFLGRVSQLKGIGELIEAARLLQSAGHEFDLDIVGHGDRPGVLEGYQKTVHENQLTDFVHFRGRLTGEEKFRAYAESDIYVFPSWTEGCPTSVLEALVAGLYILSTDVGALAEIIENDRNGQIVQLRSAEDLAAKMASACGRIEAIRSQRRQIAEVSCARFDVENIIRQFTAIYTRILR